MLGLVSKKKYNELYVDFKTEQAKNIKLVEENKDLKAELSRTICEQTVKVRKTTNKSAKKETKPVEKKNTGRKKKEVK